MSVLTAPPEPIALGFGTDGRIAGATPACGPALGQEPDRLVGQSVLEIVAPWDIPVVTAVIATLTQGAQSSVWESRHGERRVLWRARPVSQGQFEALGTDVTAERRHRRRREPAVDALRLLNAAAWRYDVRHDVLTIDTSGVDFLPRGDELRSWADLAARVRPDERQTVLDCLGLIRTHGLDLEVPVIAPDGTERCVRLRARAPEAGHGGPVTGVAWDITTTRDVEGGLVQQAMRDQLTGLANRHVLEVVLRSTWEDCQRDGSRAAVVLADVDDLAALNEDQGYLEGDRVLRAVARAVQWAARSHDLAARYGGQEMLLVLPDSDGAAARSVGEQVLDNVRRSREAQGASVSVGIAVLRPGDESMWSVVTRAARACREAKGAGKDRLRLV